MDPRDTEVFLQSLNARTVPELAKTARLWEGELVQRYRVPFFLVRVGDIRASLNSTATALILYKEVRFRSTQSLLLRQHPNWTKARGQIEPDPAFDKFVAELEQQCLADEEKHRQFVDHCLVICADVSTSRH
jgi:hypothetical protein